MPAIIEDVLQTRLDLAGLSQYSSGFTQAAEAVGILSDRLDENARKQLGIGIAAGAAAAGIITAIGKSALASEEESAAYSRAAGNFKGGFPTDEVAKFSSELQGLTGVADDQIGSFIGLLGTFQATQNQARQLALPILNASEALKAQGVDTAQLAVQVGKALQTGEPTALRRSGIILDEVSFKAANAEERTKMLAAALQAQGGDAALHFRDTTVGALQAAGNALGDVEESFGATFGPTVRTGAELVVSVSKAISGLPVGVMQAAGFAALGLAGYLSVVAVRSVGAVIQLGRVAAENVVLTNSALQATAAINAEGAALTRLGSGGGFVGPQIPGGVLAARNAGSFLRGPGGLGLLAGGAGLAITSLSGDNQAGRSIGDTLSGAGFGASLGSLAGPIGIAVGAIGGGIVGYLTSQSAQKAADPQKPTDPMLAELKRANDLKEQMLNELRGIKSGNALSEKDLPGGLQVLSWMGRNAF